MDKSDYIKRKSIPLENIDIWMEWMLNNPETAKKEYPEIMELRAKREIPFYMIAAIIEKIPEHFAKWKNDIENCLQTTRVKKINSILEILQKVLHINWTHEHHKEIVEKIRPELLEMEAYFKGLLTKPPQQQKKTSYVWQNNPDKELPELYTLMIDNYKLIASGTTLEQFKAIFTGQPIESVNPIKWHQGNASELLYFIDTLGQSNNIVCNPKKADYQRMTACFVKPDGNQFKANWKQIKQNISINLSSDKQKAIDELIKAF